MPAPDYAAEISAIESALATGELTVEQEGERVTYRSVSDLRQALTYFRSQAEQAARPPYASGRFGFSPVAFSRD